MAQIATPDLDKILEALRAVRDPSVNAQGLEALRQALHGSGGPALLAELLSRSPDLHELLAVWEAQLTAKNDEVIVALLLLLAETITLLASLPSQEQTGASTELVSYIIDRRLKALYFYLSSDSKPKSCAALVLLGALARHSVQSARQLAHSFDFSLAALAKLCRLPREKKDEGGEEAHTRLLEAWQAPEPTERPTASLFVDFALSFLAHADAALLQCLLPIRVLWSGLLSQLASFPPVTVQQILDAIQDRMLSLGSDVPASLRAQPFSDTALAQIATVAAWDTEGAPAEAAACAAAAQQILLEVLTNSSHGIAPSGDAGLGESSQDNQPGRRRVLRLLHTLKVTSLGAHYDLLLSVARQRPDVASAYLASCPLSLDPKPGLRWMAGSSILGSLIQLSPDIDFLALAARQARPQGLPSQLVSAQLRRIFPAPLSKGILTKGLQNSNGLVQQATLSTLCNMLTALQQTLLSLDRAQCQAQKDYNNMLSAQHITEDIDTGSVSPTLMDIIVSDPAMPEEGAPELQDNLPDEPESSRATMEQHNAEPQNTSKPSAAQDPELAAAAARLGAWKSLCARLRSAAAARLPDLQTLLALHAQMLQSQGADQAIGGADPGPAELSGTDLTLLHIFKVLEGYMRCLPALGGEARFTAWQVLLQDAANMHPSLQHAVLSVLQASLSSTQGGPSAAHATAEQLTSLLQLLQLGHSSSAITKLAYEVAQSYLQQAVGFDNLAEVHLWLDSLPAASTNGQPAREEAAVAKFLAEAVALLLRKPHEMWELQQGIPDAANTSNGPPLCQPDASLLAITALRQAIRVAGSCKMPEAAISAICSYVTGVLELLLRVQADRKPLSTIISRIIESSGSVSAAGSLPVGFQGNVQAEHLSAAEHQTLSSAQEHAQQPAKRQRTGTSSSISPGQPASGGLATDSQNTVPVSAEKAQKSSGRKRVREAGSPGAKLASPQGRSEAAWEVLQRLREVTKGGIAASWNQNHDQGGIRALFKAIDLLTGVDSSILTKSITKVPVKQRAVPALAIICALSSEPMQPVTAALFQGLRFCLLDREGGEMQENRLVLLVAVLKHPGLLGRYLAGSGPQEQEQHDTIVSCTADLLAQILDHAEAAEGVGNGHVSSAWAEVLAASQPYLSRTLRLLEENAASCSLKHTGQACAPYLVLARHLPFKPAAMAATALLNRDSLKGSPGADDWTTEHGVELAAGLLKHAAVGADSVAALSQLSSQGLLSSIAGSVYVHPKAAECLVDLLETHASGQGLLAWQLVGKAHSILESAIASPNHARCQLAAILLRALPLDHTSAVRLLSQGLPGMRLEDFAALLPVVRVLLEIQDAQGVESDFQQLFDAAFEVLLEWITEINLKQRGPVSTRSADSLVRHGVPVLELCLKWRCADDSQLLQLLQQLASAEGWSQLKPELTSPGSPSPAQKIALCSCIVSKLATHDAPKEAAGDAVACFGAALLTATARLTRRQDAGGASRALLGQLEETVGGVLPELLSKQPLQLCQQDTQRTFLVALQKFAIAVLRHRYRSAEHLRLLKSLLAGLLHGPSSCPAAAELVADLVVLIVLHSDFQPLMAQLSADPLPTAATHLAVPLTSLLPFVSMHADAQQQAASAKQAMLEVLMVIVSRDRGASARLAAHWESLMPALLVGYGATLSATDQATLRVLCILNAAKTEQHASAAADEDGHPSFLQAWTHEGIAGIGFVFGGVAKTLLEMGLLMGSPEHDKQRAKALKDALAIDARRCSLTVVHWPEEYLQHLSEVMSVGQEINGRALQAQQYAVHPAAYDPAFLLPFTLQVIRDELMSCLEVATSGLLAVVLRGLACSSAALRSSSYEALALYNDALEQSNFREKTQLSMLMSLTRQSIQEPLQRLPALTAVYLAEASCALTQPSCDLFPAVSRHLSRKLSLNLQEAPLLKQLLSSSSPEQAAERLWLVRLLAAGFQDQTEGDIFRRQFVAELLMSIHDSALANAELATAIEGVICNICARAPTYAADLVQQAGLVSWLSATIGSKMKLQRERELSTLRDAVQSQPTGRDVKRLLTALQALLDAKEWRTAAKVGSLGALDVFAGAAGRLLIALAESCRGWWAVPGAAQVLQYALDVQLHINSSWEEEMSQPKWQPWASLTTLFSAQEAIPETHKALLLQFVLASPPPVQAGSRSFTVITRWALNAACGLCQHAASSQAVTVSLQGVESAQDKSPPHAQHPTAQPESRSLAARVLPWLALCLASQASAPSAAMAGTALPEAADSSGGHFTAQQTRGLLQEDETAPSLAEKVVHLYYALGQLRDPTTSAAAFAMAQLLQPDIQALLMGTAATQGQGRAEWRFLLGNTFLRMLDHLKLDQDQLQTWQQAARDKCAPSIAARKEVGAEEQAALKMLLVMLPEFCMQQAPVLTSRVLRLWESGNAGLLKQRLAEQELRHAHVVGVVLQS